ncbi:hypothetical protein M9H77_06883 [Catharanthus roseus]|uniref:Uncharacterized protein n=1 Tax=Catharanthus roseus TaxID=4058 RepID=A0ACC0BTL3_CATRO|nr:hypothetical protein M9H77_06883 [Catharanthus roseus]
MKNYRREYDEYHEGYDHSAHTHANFGEPSKNHEERIVYNSIKTISFFSSNSYLCFEIYFKEIKLFSLDFIEHGDHFIFFNSLGTYLERRYLIESNSITAILRVDDYDFIEDRRSMEKELGPILEYLSMSLSVSPSSLSYEVSLEELKNEFEENPFKGRGDGMSRDAQGTLERFQGPITRAMDRRMRRSTKER